MAQKISNKTLALRNPGCSFCRYFLAPFEYQGEMTREACSKGARKVFQQVQTPKVKRKWRWVDCSYSEEKNKDRYCQDFQIHSLPWSMVEKLHLRMQNSGEQLPPAYAKEKWWDT